MLRIFVGLAVIIIGFIYHLQPTLASIIGILLIASAIADGAFQDLLFITSKSTNKNIEDEWAKKFINNEESKRWIQKFANKIIEKDIKTILIKEKSISFDKKELFFSDINKKNLTDLGCKVMARELKKELENTHNIKTSIIRVEYVDYSFEGYELKILENRIKDW